MTEDSSQPSAESNPYWAAAQERLRSAGVGVTHAAKPPPPSATAYPPYAAPMYPYYNAAPYTPVAMPTASTPAAYNWYATPAPPPPPPPTFVPNRLPVPRQQHGGASIPFNYNQVRPIRGQHHFQMNFNAAPTRPTSNPFSPPTTNAQDEELGEPNSGFHLKGKHPPSLKTYVKRALEHPKNPADMRKCEDYLYGRIGPLIMSGAVFAVKWELEPLPHEKNYQLTTQWTPASVMKGKANPKDKSKFGNSGGSGGSKNGKGPDILLSKPRKGKDRAPQLEGPIFARGPAAAAAAASAASTNSKKRKNKGPDAAFFFDHDAYFDSKRSRPSGDVSGAAGAKYGTNHSDNWLEDWVAERRVRGTSTSGTLSRLQVLSLSEKPYRRAKAQLPQFDGSRLARTFPRVLRGMGQGVVNEYFDRNLDRFNPDDCEEVIGQSYDLEKKYFRLTKKPDAAEIRPLNVLQRAFNRLQSIAREDPSKYKYVCDQLRSIRQDLTVQKIRDHFTVAVYEFHARITLENGDLSEFNQCQSQLRHLYADLPGCKNEFEFTAYRLLYYIHTQDEQDILSLLSDLTPQARAASTVKLAIEVHDAFLKGNYIRLFKLYKNTPRMCGNVMELFLERERRRFFSMIRVSFRPNTDVDILTRWFNFDSGRDFCEYMLTQGVSVKPGEKTEPPKWPVKPPPTST